MKLCIYFCLQYPTKKTSRLRKRSMSSVMTLNPRQRRSRCTFASNMAANGAVWSSKKNVQNGRLDLKEVKGKQVTLSEQAKNAQLLVRTRLYKSAVISQCDECTSC
jgi:hypothetical protein